MKSFLILSLVFTWSFSAFSQECASNVAQLKQLVGNSDLATAWVESGKNPLVLNVRNGKNTLLLSLTKDGQSWADVTGKICKKGEKYLAKVETLNWGPAAPGMVKSAKIKQITLTLPYHSLLKVRVSLMTFEFQPL